MSINPKLQFTLNGYKLKNNPGDNTVMLYKTNMWKPIQNTKDMLGLGRQWNICMQLGHRQLRNTPNKF